LDFGRPKAEENFRPFLRTFLFCVSLPFCLVLFSFKKNTFLLDFFKKQGCWFFFKKNVSYEWSYGRPTVIGRDQKGMPGLQRKLGCAPKGLAHFAVFFCEKLNSWLDTRLNP